MKRETCKTCSGWVVQAQTLDGKPITLDYEPDPKGNIVLELLAGDVLLARVLSPPALAERIGHRYRSHFDTCRSAAIGKKR